MTSRFALSSSGVIFMKVCCYRTGSNTENKEDRDNRTNTVIMDIIEAFWQFCLIRLTTASPLAMYTVKTLLKYSNTMKICTSRRMVPSQSTSLITTSQTFFTVVLARPALSTQKQCRKNGYLFININQLDALYFIISLFQASTCANVLIVRRAKLYYRGSRIITPIGVMIPETV